MKTKRKMTKKPSAKCDACRGSGSDWNAETFCRAHEELASIDNALSRVEPLVAELKAALAAPFDSDEAARRAERARDLLGDVVVAFAGGYGWGTFRPDRGAGSRRDRAKLAVLTAIEAAEESFEGSSPNGGQGETLLTVREVLATVREIRRDVDALPELVTGTLNDAIEHALDAIRPGLGAEALLRRAARHAETEAEEKGLTGEVARAYVRQFVQTERESIGDEDALRAPLPEGGLVELLLAAIGQHAHAAADLTRRTSAVPVSPTLPTPRKGGPGGSDSLHLGSET